MLAYGDNKIDLSDELNKANVQYNLKSIEILNSDKAEQIFEKGNKNNWNIDKILQELAIPKEQKELVKQSYLDGNKAQNGRYRQAVQYVTRIRSYLEYIKNTPQLVNI